VTTYRLTAITTLLLAIVLLCAITPPAYADNTDKATSVVVCSYSYTHPDAQGKPQSTNYDSSMYVLDPPTRTNRANLETREQYYAMWRMAGIYNHEYINYPAYPTSVVPSDLQGWHCSWSSLP
jgi:hypothetical protein